MFKGVMKIRDNPGVKRFDDKTIGGQKRNKL